MLTIDQLLVLEMDDIRRKSEGLASRFDLAALQGRNESRPPNIVRAEHRRTEEPVHPSVACPTGPTPAVQNVGERHASR